MAGKLDPVLFGSGYFRFYLEIQIKNWIPVFYLDPVYYLDAVWPASVFRFLFGNPVIPVLFGFRFYLDPVISGLFGSGFIWIPVLFGKPVSGFPAMAQISLECGGLLCNRVSPRKPNYCCL